METLIGQKLREVRREQGLSLQQVAHQADISIATLSRIETDKQPLDLNLFIELAQILRQSPSEMLLGSGSEKDEKGRLIQKISALGFTERMQLWNELASAARERVRDGNRKGQGGQLVMQVEELLAQVDFLRAEIQSVSKRLRGV